MITPTMEVANVTRSGFLSPLDSGEEIALISEEGRIWTRRHLWEAFDSAAALKLSGRIGVLIKDRLLSGLVSCAVMRDTTCVPLDPAMTATEIKDRSAQLQLAATITDDREFSADPAVIIARREGHKLLFEGAAPSAPTSGDALILMTSGSTGRPKVVALSHQNLLHSTAAIIESLSLTPADRAVNLLPTSHIGGLVDLFLVPLISGGSVVFGEARSPESVLSLLKSQKPTWLQTAPAILQGLVKAARGPIDHHLRLIRSVSAPLSPALASAASQAFRVPLIEMYGMSETGGVITSNPLPPALPKIGSVGRPVNCAVEIRNDGEVWVRSGGLFAGYDQESDNEGLWDDDFFFTGDLGHLDVDGDLFLTGRAKELINRGGQKVSPAEIDALVGEWEEIAEVASFSFPHQTLAEEVGLAMVFREGQALDDREIRKRLSSSLADYKLPKRLLRLEKLPRNQNGKLQRFLLAEIAPREARTTAEATATEKRLLPLWLAALNTGECDHSLDFFDQGGDSLSATTLLASVEKEFKITLDGFIFYENATVNALAKAVDERLIRAPKALARDPDFPLRIQKRLRRFLSSWPGKPPFTESYARIDSEGSPENPFLFWCCNGVKELDFLAGAIRPFLTLISFRSLRLVQHKKLRNRELITAVYLDEIERIQPEGPLFLGGFCEGGRIMHEIGQALIKKGREVRLLVLQDHNLEEPFPARIALIHSDVWKRHPLRLHHNIHHGWEKIYRGRFGVFRKEGGHSRAFRSEVRADLQDFLKEQFEKSQDEMPPPLVRQDPDCEVTLLSKIPRLFNGRRTYPARIRVTNHGPNTLRADDGLVLHARWVDLDRSHKAGPPMFNPLPADLPAGDSVKFELEISAHKRKRLYQLQIALIEEGWGWHDATPRKSHRHWHLIC